MIQILLALAILIAVLGIVNTLALSVLERTRELGVMRAIGISRLGAFGLMLTESTLLAIAGGLLGFVIAGVAGRYLERIVRPFVPLAPDSGLPCALLANGRRPHRPLLPC